MTAALISTLAVCFGFVALMIWTFRPGAKDLWEERGRALLDSDTTEDTTEDTTGRGNDHE
jgi:hypothetical protein